MRHATVLAVFTALIVAGCAAPPPPKPAPPPKLQSTVRHAQANLASASGSLVSGRVDLRAMDDGVHLSGTVGGFLPNSVHAIHVHEKGDCSAADASSAGPHFNPTASAHGRAGTPTHHAGDMDNIVAGADGTVRLNIHLRDVTMGTGAPNDIIGRGLVVHAAADDYTSQPAGNSGARVACAPIRAVP